MVPMSDATLAAQFFDDIFDLELLYHLHKNTFILFIFSFSEHRLFTAVKIIFPH